MALSRSMFKVLAALAQSDARLGVLAWLVAFTAEAIHRGSLVGASSHWLVAPPLALV